MSHEVQEMTKHPGWTYLVDRSNVTRSSKQKSILNGNAKTVEEYKEMTGWLDGANFIISLPARLHGEVESLRIERAELAQQG